MKLSRTHLVSLIATPAIAAAALTIAHQADHAKPGTSSESAYAVSQNASISLPGIGTLLPPAPVPLGSLVPVPPVGNGPATCC